MHSIVWFWTTGIHDPAWVQAFAAIVLVALTLVTLIYLRSYVKDTHTLARTSLEQIILAREERSFEVARKSHAAYDCLMKAKDDLEDVGKSLVDGTFGSKPQPAIYSESWPDVTSAFGQRKFSTYTLMASLGVDLRGVDLAVKDFFSASDNNEKILREVFVCKKVEDAVESYKSVMSALEEIGKP
jgi:hypothetical protein